MRKKTVTALSVEETVDYQVDSKSTMRKRILTGLAVVAAVLVIGAVAFSIVVAMQPTEFRVVRTATIAAPPAVVFDQVNDFHNWDAWSPWAKLDPDAKNSFEGSEKGEGAIFMWSGNDKIGEGKMTLTQSKPDELIKIKLEFIRPFEDQSDVEFTFEPKEKQTLVTWSMAGQNKDFMSKAFCLVMNMDKMLGSDFEKGLASMKTIAEEKAKAN